MRDNKEFAVFSFLSLAEAGRGRRIEEVQKIHIMLGEDGWHGPLNMVILHLLQLIASISDTQKRLQTCKDDFESPNSK